MYFKRHEAIYTLNDKPLELVELFTYLSCNLSSTESDVNIHIRKARTDNHMKIRSLKIKHSSKMQLSQCYYTVAPHRL